MGHSATDFRGRGFFTKDAKLDLWLILLAREVDHITECPEWLAEARDHWTTVGDRAGVGCINADLDRFLTDQARIEAVATLSESALRFLSEELQILSCDFLNELTSAGPNCYFTGDVESEQISRVGRTFLRLLRGDPEMAGESWPNV